MATFWMGKDTADDLSDKVLISKINKELTQLKNKQKTIWLKK